MSINLSSIDSENFCVAPWVNIHIGLSGEIKPCCHGKPKFGSLQDSNWSYIDGSNIGLKNLREELLSGANPDYCSGCNEKQWYNEFSKDGIRDKHTNDFALKSTDIRWGNTCQLSCTYCNSMNSSTWAQLKSAEKIHPRLFREQTEPLFQFLNFNKDLLKRVSLVGGEPLLLNENLDLLELIPESVGVEVITNLNVNLSSNKIYQQLIKRENVHWYVSMETVGAQFEFVRRRASWEVQTHNLTKLSQEVHSTCQIKLQSQYCVYSALNLRELYNWSKSISNVEVNLVAGLSWPVVLDIFLFPNEFKQQAQAEINNILKRNDLTHFEKSSINLVSQKLLESHNCKPNIVSDCITWHSEQESKYFNNQFDFLTLWPQYRV